MRSLSSYFLVWGTIVEMPNKTLEYQDKFLVFYMNAFLKSIHLEGAVLRWQRNRMGRPFSPLQIHQKDI